MPPQPLITPPPTLPAHLASRQTTDDPYGINSLLAQYSSDYLALYSSVYESYMNQFNSQAGIATNTRRTRPTQPSINLDPSDTASAATNGNKGGSSSSGGGLSSGAKIGIGVAVPLVVLILVGVGVFLWCAGKRKGKKSSTTIVAPNVAQVPPQQFQPQPQVYPQNQGYLPGYQQPPQQFSPTPPPQFAPGPPQYTPGKQGVDQSALGAYAKGPPEGVVELETEYYFARGGAVEMGDTEPKAPEKKGPSWRKMIGSGTK